jgi:hypothetical protein
VTSNVKAKPDPHHHDLKGDTVEEDTLRDIVLKPSKAKREGLTCERADGVGEQTEEEVGEDGCR